MSLSVVCHSSDDVTVTVGDSARVGDLYPSVKFCPVCGMSVAWGWFGVVHTVTDTETGARVWSPNEFLGGSAESNDNATVWNWETASQEW